MNRALLVTVVLLRNLSSFSQADSRCSIRAETHSKAGEISCSYKTKRINSSLFTERDVLYEIPTGTPPAEGWPVVLYYQGSNTPVEFTRNTTRPINHFYETQTIQQLLDNGYAVIAPRPLNNSIWMTNILGPLTPYIATPDYHFFKNLFRAINNAEFGPLDSNRKYAAGQSSGGYNVSRMAISFRGEFKALVIHSASYANCAGPLCILPALLPSDHPPTLFTHGDSDKTVPWSTMNKYYDKLLFKGITTSQYTELGGGHTYFEKTAELTLDWFERNP